MWQLIDSHSGEEARSRAASPLPDRSDRGFSPSTIDRIERLEIWKSNPDPRLDTDTAECQAFDARGNLLGWIRVDEGGEEYHEGLLAAAALVADAAGHRGPARQGAAAVPAPSPGPVGPTATNRSCPRCAETIKAEALVCRFCGADLSGHPGAVPAPTPAPGAVPAATPEGPYREAVIVTGRMRTGTVLATLASVAALVTAVMSFGVTPSPFHWGEGSVGLMVGYMRAPILFILGVFAAMVLQGIGARAVHPPRRGIGALGSRAFMLKLYREHRVRLFARRGCLVVFSLATVVWLGMLGIVLYNGNEISGMIGWEHRAGYAICLAASVLGAVGAALAIPSPGAGVVKVFDNGAVTLP